MRRGAALVLSLLVPLAGCGPRGPAPTLLRKHPALQARAAGLRIAVLPPQVTVQELAFDDDVVRLRELENSIEAEITQRIEATLLERQVTVQPGPVDATTLALQRAERFQLSELFQSYKQMSWKAYRKGALPPDQAFQCEQSMGPAVNRFSERAQADALVFASFDGVVKSSGLRGRDTFFQVVAALGGAYVEMPAAAATFEIALVDGTTGELLWANRVGATYRNAIDATFVVNLALREFPSTSTVGAETRRR